MGMTLMLMATKLAIVMRIQWLNMQCYTTSLANKMSLNIRSQIVLTLTKKCLRAPCIGQCTTASLANKTSWHILQINYTMSIHHFTLGATISPLLAYLLLFFLVFHTNNKNVCLSLCLKKAWTGAIKQERKKTRIENKQFQ